MDRECTRHDSLIEGQATIANELVHLKKEINDLTIIMRGTNGISGMVGWFQERKGEMRATAKLHGAIGGIIMLAIAIIIRAAVMEFME